MMPAGQEGLSLQEIAAQLGGDILGDGQTRVSQVATLASARPGQIAFLANPKYRAQLSGTRASAVILAPDAADDTDLPRLLTPNPYAYYARLAAMLNPPPALPAGIAATAVCESAIPASVAVGPGVHVGKNVDIGENVILHAGCVIGDGVKIGAGSRLYPNVSVYHGCSLGRNVIIHSGTVIGADGFGFAPEGGKWLKIPQIGGVVIGDDVEIGANTTVDRGALDDTVIGEGCKIDNQVQIAHNCVIGDYTVIAGCAGIAGSTRIGARCQIGGAAMIIGHLEIAAGSVISAGTMVMKSIRKAGRYTAVYPLAEHDDWIHNAAHLRQLNKLAERIARLEKELSNKQP